MEIKPYEWQAEALGCLAKAQGEGKKSGLVVMATGLGKTYTAAWFTKRWLREDPSAKVLVLAHQTELLSQFREDLRSIIGLYVQKVEIATFQFMRQHLTQINPFAFDLVIVDETHHVPAKSYSKVVKHFKPRFLLGLTATPDREDGQSLDRYFGDPVYRMDLPHALIHGYLVAPKYQVFQDDAILGGRRKSAKFGKSASADVAMLEDVWKRLLTCGAKKTLMFCPSVEAADLVAAYLPTAKSVHFKTPQEERALTLKEFKHGELPIVVSVDLFNEGIDVPHVDSVVFLRSTASQRIFLQQLGRGLRKCPGKESVQVFDYVANLDRLEQLQDLQRAIRESLRSQKELSGSDVEVDEDLLSRQGIEFRFDAELSKLPPKRRLRSQEVTGLPRRLRGLWSYQQLIDWGVAIALTKGRVPVASDFSRVTSPETPSRVCAERKWGSMRAYQESIAARCDIVLPAPRRPRTAWTEESLLVAGIALAEKLGRVPYESEVISEICHDHPIRQRFGRMSAYQTRIAECTGLPMSRMQQGQAERWKQST